MPCIMREKTQLFCPRRKKRNQIDILAPKPVRPRSIRNHGLFGMSYAAQHFIVDEKWTPSSLIVVFTNMNELLKRNVIYKQCETNANNARLQLESNKLKAQCSNGRIKLQKTLVGNNAREIHNILINHRDLQCLYKHMSIHQVLDNLDQRTFVMHKDRDRLSFRMNQLKLKLKQLLVDKASLENRIRFENNFVLDEEVKSRVLLKKINDSNLRLKAIRVINTTYKKIVDVLHHDEIYYEPILRSLNQDIDDQANMIRNILYMGTPAIATFRELERKFHLLWEKSHNNYKEQRQMLSKLVNSNTDGILPPKIAHETRSSKDKKRYLHHTRSMSKLKWELISIEKVIKELKFATLVSHAGDIYPCIKSRLENNKILRLKIDNDLQSYHMFRYKKNNANMMQKALMNNLSKEEIKRLLRIKELKIMLKNEENFEQETLSYLKNRADIYVMLRINMWNLLEVLRHVGCSPKVSSIKYPKTYLTLPFFKFEFYQFQIPIPTFYQENIDEIMELLKIKIWKLIQGYKKIFDCNVENSANKYHADYMASLADHRIFNNEYQEHELDDSDHDKSYANIPSRIQLRVQKSSRMSNGP